MHGDDTASSAWTRNCIIWCMLGSQQNGVYFSDGKPTWIGMKFVNSFTVQSEAKNPN